MDTPSAMSTVSMKRERGRRKRLWRLAAVLALFAVWFWSRFLRGLPPFPGMPEISEDAAFWLPGIAIVVLLGLVLVLPMISNSRSPHVTFRPEQIEVGFSDVVGLGRVVEEVNHTLSVMLNHEKFRKEMGGRPRRGALFEGPPGTGKTHLAKALAKEAEVPFLFVSATAFQSMWFGMTARRIKAFFKALRKAARKEGGAIGFIEEIDAIGLERSGSASAMTSTDLAKAVERSVSSDTGGMAMSCSSRCRASTNHRHSTSSWARSRAGSTSSCPSTASSRSVHPPIRTFCSLAPPIAHRRSIRRLSALGVSTGFCISECRDGSRGSN